MRPVDAPPGEHFEPASIACPYLMILLSCTSMKTTIDVDDTLLARAKRHARKAGKPLRALVEEGLRRVLMESEATRPGYQLPDRSVGKRGAPDPLERLSWQDLRGEIYPDR
jgi:Arc/MetJ family transcription regulator